MKRPLLTPSERALLVLLANGRTITELMRETGKARHTLNTHRSNAYRKLGAHGREEAVRNALALGEIDRDELIVDSRRLTDRLGDARARIVELEQQLNRVRELACGGDRYPGQRLAAIRNTLDARKDAA